jgi:DNA-binding NtrC family response regulator
MSTFVHIIDDHEDSVETMTILLQSEGFKVMAHSSFSKALAELNHAPCIVFADYRVPDKIAFSEFVDECRRLHPDTTIVMTTGDSRARQVAEALGVDFMLKPIDVDDIVAAAKRLCPSRSS